MLEEQLNAKVTELSSIAQKIRQLDNLNQRLTSESQSFQTQAKKTGRVQEPVHKFNGDQCQTYPNGEEK